MRHHQMFNLKEVEALNIQMYRHMYVFQQKYIKTNWQNYVLIVIHSQESGYRRNSGDQGYCLLDGGVLPCGD